MNNEETDKVLEAAELLFLKDGYGYVTIEQLGEETELPEAQLRQVFPNKALICSAWLDRKDINSEKIHEAILVEAKPAIDKVDNYFASLAIYMEENRYRGCPFTRVSSTMESIQAEDQPVVDSVIKHKKNIEKFFINLAGDLVCDDPEILGKALFLLYSGATTESRNMRSMEPIYAARKSAIILCQAYA